MPILWGQVRTGTLLCVLLVLLCFACDPTDTTIEATPTAKPQPQATPEPTPLDALEARRWDAALRVCDALENTLLVSEPAFFLGALQFARDEGMRKSELAEAMQRECPGAFGALRYEPDLRAEFEKLP